MQHASIFQTTSRRVYRRARARAAASAPQRPPAPRRRRPPASAAAGRLVCTRTAPEVPENRYVCLQIMAVTSGSLPPALCSESSFVPQQLPI